MSATVSITKQYRFEAAHQLPYHQGKCARPHGHSYILEVSVTGPIQETEPHNPESGMVVDFDTIGSIIKPLVAELDHHDLNRVLDNSTAERLVLWIVDAVRDRFKLLGVTLSQVRLFETATGWVTWTPA